jgi:hypothetical protein
MPPQPADSSLVRDIPPSERSTPSRRPRGEVRFALASYALTVGYCLLIGYRMQIPYSFPQLLDVRLLESRLAESLLYLHAQPPLPNLILGLALKLQNATGWGAERILLVLHFALGALAVAALVRAAAFLLPDAPRRQIALALIVLHPVFYMTLFEYFYTFHETVILAFLPILAWLYLRHRSPFVYAACCSLFIALSYTRSLFHFAGAFAMALSLVLLARPLPAAFHRAVWREALILMVMAGLLLAWPVKNWVIFDSFTYSTWQGYNLARGLLPDLPSGEEVERPDPPPEFDIPVLAWVEKSDPALRGAPPRNWNHYALIADFKERQRLAVEVLRDRPTLLLTRAAFHYWCYSRFTGRDPYTASFGTTYRLVPPLADPWMRVFEALLVQEFRPPYYLRSATSRSDPTRFWHVSGFFFTFPLIVFFSIRKIRRGWSDDPPTARVAALMLLPILWVFAMVLLVDGEESNRMRVSTEPLTILLALWVIPPAFVTSIRDRVAARFTRR